MSGAAPVVRIRGGGIAALCCAHLLHSAGMRVLVDPVARQPVPAILLSDQALALMRDVFERPTLFADRSRIVRRLVSWGGTGELVALSHGAVVVSEDDLLDSLGGASEAESAAQADFTIHTAPPLPEGALHRFGSRRAAVTEVGLRDAADPASCWIEAVAAGWLFLIPTAPGRARLLAVGALPEALLAESRHIAGQIVIRPGAEAGAFDACPRLYDPLCGMDWLACGSAAIGFDPICGDGTAQAVREAILASAVLVGIAEGGDAGALREHYAAVMLAAMRRHLALSVDFYRTGGDGPWWRAEHDALMEGHGWCTARLGAMPEPRYRLDGFRLAAREAAL